MTQRRPSQIAWYALVGGIITYEAFAPEEELMSEGVDRALERHPIIVRVALLAIALHLVNWLPNRIDPLYIIADAFGRGKRHVRR